MYFPIQLKIYLYYLIPVKSNIYNVQVIETICIDFCSGKERLSHIILLLSSEININNCDKYFHSKMTNVYYKFCLMDE